LASTPAVDQLHRRFAFDVDYNPVTRAVRYARDDLAEFVARTASARGLACAISTGARGYYLRLVISRPGPPSS